MTNNWKTKRLDEISTVTMGQSPSSTSYNDQGVGVPFFQGKPSSIDTQGVANPSQYTTEPTKIVEAGTALMCVRAPVGDMFITPIDVCIGRGLSGIKANPDISQKYLNYQLQFVSQQFHNLSQGSTFTAINSSDLKSVQVGVPTFIVQQRIADILSSVDEAIQKTDQIIKKSENLKQGLMQELLIKGIGHKKFKVTKLGEIPEEWEIVRFKDICDIQRSKFDPKINESEKYVGLEHISQGGGSLIATGTSSKTSSLKTQFKTGNILFGKLRPYLRKYWLAEFDGVCSTEILVFKTKQYVDAQFAFYIVQSEKFINHSISKSFGTKMPRTDWKILCDFTFGLPTFDEQKRITAIISSIDDKIRSELVNQKHLKALKTSLMQDIFSQKIQVN